MTDRLVPQKKWSDAELTALLERFPGRRLSPALLRAMTRGWSVPASDVVEWRGAAPRRARRRVLAADFPGVTLVVPAGRPAVRTNDLPFAYRPGTDHMWLAGPTEPGSVLVLGPDGEETLYVAEQPALGHPNAVLDVHGPLIEGPLETCAATAVRLGVETRPIGELGKRLRGTAAKTVRGLDPHVDALVADDGRELEKQLARRRLYKDAYEIAQLRHTADVTVEGFAAVARALPDAVRHGQAFVEGVFAQHARTHGRGLAFTPIVGSGHQATILHWQRNDQRIGPGDLLLLDAGVEGPELYASDVARTMPVSGRYTSAQRDVHDIVHAAHQAALAAARPGGSFTDPHQAAQRVLADGLHSLGVLPHPAFDGLAAGERSWRWTLHVTSHMLGADVHDSLVVAGEYTAGTLEPGHVLAVEPGLYFSPFDDYVPEHLRGIGVRIEDNVVVEDNGIEVLTAALPTSATGIEDWIADHAR
ncbi:aminopeptidase P N-terminal domain-containing protein [Amycolatopsis jiangsuensis]|uniref:Xaa-Pro aminopeptidase n=1 Tax=Amycolatopsis jiangsuensis TaxID=1181879 RepID=A0A840J2H6_9PSEU|nr:aminopeptidase P N-terminal domain-containing protein [Amycolatopsis jiangsuensis]MBB4689261.1 Xaa-Pro aminopeptidase [Amycolatopsis jiangsuensis]